MTDECISTATIEYITRATLMMASSSNSADMEYSRRDGDDRPDALGMGILDEESNAIKTNGASGIQQNHQSNGKVR